MYAFDIPPPEVTRNSDGNDGCQMIDGVLGGITGVAEIRNGLSDKSNDILAGRHTRDRSGEYVIEHQRRDAEFCKRPTHRLFDYAVDAAAREHRAALDVNRAHRITEEHHAEDEPGCSPPHGLLGYAASIESGRGEIV